MLPQLKRTRKIPTKYIIYKKMQIVQKSPKTKGTFKYKLSSGLKTYKALSPPPPSPKKKKFSSSRGNEFKQGEYFLRPYQPEKGPHQQMLQSELLGPLRPPPFLYQ